MATIPANSTVNAEIEFIPDDGVELVREEIEFIPDDEPVAPEVVAGAEKSVTGALQVLDVMAAPRRLDWRDVNQRFDTERLQESESLRAQARLAEEQGSGTGPGSEAFGLKRQAEAKLEQITPYSGIGRQLSQEGIGELRQIEEVDSTDQRNAVPPLISELAPIVRGGKESAGAAGGGALGAAMFLTPGGGILRVLGPILGGLGGGMVGGAVQERLTTVTETPGDTAARREETAQIQAENPGLFRLGQGLANIPFFGPSMAQFAKAAGGDKAAQASLAAAAGIGAGISGAAQLTATGEVSPAEMIQSGIENMILNRPTRLGQRMGFHVDTETGTVRTPEGTKKADGATVQPESAEGVALRALKGPEIVEPTPPAIEFIPDDAGTVASVEGDAFSGVSQRNTEAGPSPTPTPTEPSPKIPAEETAAAPESPSIVPVETSSAVSTPEGTVQGEPTGIRNAIVDEARAKSGMVERELPGKRSFGTVWDEAKAAVAQDPTAGRRLVTELKTQVRPLTDVEDAILTYEQTQREAAQDAAIEAVNSAKTPEELEAAQGRLAAAQEEAFEVYTVGQQPGTANARGLNARRLMINRDYSLAKMLNETRAVVNEGKPLSNEQAAEVTQLHAKITELEGKLATAENTQATKDAQAEYRRILSQTKKDATKAAKARTSIVDFFDSKAEQARQRIIARRGRLNVTIDPLNIAGLVDEAIIGASYVAKGVRDFANWSQKMVEDFGDRIKPHLDALFAKASSLVDDNAKSFVSADEIANAKTPEQIVSSIQKGSALDQRTVYELARAHVRAGVDGFENVIKAVHDDLAPIHEGISEREIRDAFSGYGKITKPSKESDLVKLREYRNLARLTSQLEDAQKGLAPLKTGPQRDKTTAKVRDLQKQVNDVMRKAGIHRTSPETQIASAHSARVSRLRNAIEETEAAIVAGKRRNQPEPLPWTPEETALRDQLQEVKARLDDALSQPDNDKLQGILRRVEAVSERIKSGNIGAKPKSQGPDTKEVTQAKDELLKLNKELSDLRKSERLSENPPKTQDEKRLAALEKQREDLFERVRKGDIDTRVGRATADTAEQARVRSEIQDLNKQMSEMRKAAKPRRPVDQTQLNALQKRLDAAKAKLASGDVAPVSRTKATVDTERVAKARSELTEVNRRISELRKGSDELRLAQDKKRIEAQIKAVQDRIKSGDYEPVEKREPAMDREKLNLQFELAKTKEEYQKGLIEAKRAKRGMGEKIWDTTLETLNLSRQLLTSGDLPPVFRQGLFSIGRPKMTGKALVDAFKALGSEKQRFRVMQEIENRTNAPLYSRSKLYLAKDGGQTLSQQEEAYMGNWFKNLPRWTGVGPFLRASERSYNTFLNKLRADTFDAMVKAYSVADTDTATLKRVADIINTMTGRATLPGKALNQGAGALNAFLFAPRFMASRFKLVAGEPMWTGDAKTRTFALEQYARTLAGAAVVYSLAKMAGAEIETDPRSTDFLKIKFGNTRIDPLGGLIQVTTFLTRLVTGETKDSKGRVSALREDYRPLKGTRVGARGKSTERMGSTIGTFLRSKLNPVAGTAINYGTGKTITGERFDLADTAKSMAVPISFQDIAKTMEEQGVPKGTALWILSLFGAGLNTYEKR